MLSATPSGHGIVPARASVVEAAAIPTAAANSATVGHAMAGTGIPGFGVRAGSAAGWTWSCDTT